MIVQYNVIQKLYMIKILYAQVNIRTQLQAKYLKIQLRNDQGHKDKKYHRNMQGHIIYIDMY